MDKIFKIFKSPNNKLLIPFNIKNLAFKKHKKLMSKKSLNNRK